MKSGFLNKRGQLRKSWKRRFVVLHDAQRLEYFASEGDAAAGKARGVLHLDATCSVDRCDVAGREHCFVVRTPHKELVCQAETGDEAEDWVFALALSCGGGET